MKRGEPVVVMYLGRKMTGLVLAVRDNLPSHLGEDGEPLLTVALIDPERETGLTRDKDGNVVYPFGRIPQVFTEIDVVHESHEFDAEFLKANGSSTAQIASQRGHGEWSEYVDESSAALVSSLRSSNSLLRDQLSSALRDSADARGAKDVAEAKVVQLGEEVKRLQQDLDAADSKAADLERKLASIPAPIASDAPQGAAGSGV